MAHINRGKSRRRESRKRIRTHRLAAERAKNFKDGSFAVRHPRRPRRQKRKGGAKQNLHARSVNHNPNNAASGSRIPGRGEAFKTDSLPRHDPSCASSTFFSYFFKTGYIPRKCSLMGNYSASGKGKKAISPRPVT